MGQRLYELSENPLVQNSLFAIEGRASIKAEEIPCPPIDTFLDWLLNTQTDEPSTPLGWRDYEGAPPCPWQDDRADGRSKFFFQLGAHKQIEFKDRNGVKMFLFRKEIKSKVWEICKLFHALSDRSYPPKMDYRKMKELERRCDELIEETIGLLKEEGSSERRRSASRSPSPRRKAFLLKANAPKAPTMRRNRGRLAARPPRLSQHKDAEKHGDAANVTFGRPS